MEAFLLDTSILSIWLDPLHSHHRTKSFALAALPVENPRYVSVVALAELSYGVELAAGLGKRDLTTLKAIIAKARSRSTIEITHHTATEYAELKAKIAIKYLAKTARKHRPKYIEEWVDNATGRNLGIDENDLWQCAQARERGLVFITADRRMQRIADADSELKLLVI